MWVSQSISRVASNKKADQIAATIIRSVVRAHRMTVLIHEPPANAGDDESELLQDLLKEKGKAGGTLAMLEVRGKQRNSKKDLRRHCNLGSPLTLSDLEPINACLTICGAITHSTTS